MVTISKEGYDTDISLIKANLMTESVSDHNIIERKSLKNYHQSLLKLVDLFEEECINEEQLKDIVKNIKNHTEEISWNTEHERLLKNLGEVSGIYYFLHTSSSDKYKRCHYSFTFPMFLITLISSVCSFFAVDCTNPSLYLGFTAGILNLIVATLQKTMEFLQPEYWAIQHENSAKAFRYLNDDIRTQLALREPERELMPAYLNKITTEYYIQKKNAPKIPGSVLSHYKTKISQLNKIDIELSLPEEICFIKPITIAPKTKITYSQQDDGDLTFELPLKNCNNSNNSNIDGSDMINQVTQIIQKKTPLAESPHQLVKESDDSVL